MLRKVIISFLFGTVWLSLLACDTMKGKNTEAFKIKGAYYQTWVVSDNEKGTDIILIIKKVQDGVAFDSIVFRGVRLKAFVTRDNKGVNIKSVLTSGKSRLHIQGQVVNIPDQLIYHFHGERKSYPLKTIKPKATKFYKIK
jgi:hypothetical protein